MTKGARFILHCLVQIVLGLGCFVLFWLAGYLAESEPGWKNPEALTWTGICAAAALTVPFLGTRFIGGAGPRWTALAFSGWFFVVATVSVGSIFGEGDQWAVFAFWAPVALAVYGLAWMGSRLGLKKPGRLFKNRSIN